MENPLVSIIVRTKDRPRMLNRALQSISRQFYRPLEVILVNDGGCDINLDTVRSILGDITLNYRKLERNTGRAHAGNVGIQAIQGEYFGFLDDDDELYPEHVTLLIQALQSNDFKVAYTDAEVVYLSNVDTSEDILETAKFPRESIDFSFETLLLQNYISFMTLLFHKEVLSEAGGFNEQFDLCEDWDFIIRIGSKYPFSHIREITAKYTFWSAQHQVTIGDEKLSPYRLKILAIHKNKITPEVLYRLVYEGKWLGDLIIAQRINALGEEMATLGETINDLKAENDALRKRYPDTSPPLIMSDGEQTKRDVLQKFEYPAVSVILRVKNEGKTLDLVITRIRDQNYPNRIEIVVVDSGSIDDTITIATKHNCRIVTIKPEEFTFGKALNIGYRAATGDIFVNLSGHTIPTDTFFLKNLISPYEDPLVGATFGRNVPLPEACPSESRDLDIWFPDLWIDVPERFSNGNASLRREVWEKLPFDEEVTGSEDIIWAKQIMKKGYQVIYVPTAAAHHSHSSSLLYAYQRRFRETKAIVQKDGSYSMFFGQFLRWTVKQSRDDLLYAKRQGVFLRWFFHIPLYRFSQGLAIYKAARKRKDYGAHLAQKIRASKEHWLGYIAKSRRVVQDEGWKIFFKKVGNTFQRAFKRRQVIIAQQEAVRAPIQKFPTLRKFRVLYLVDSAGTLTNHYRAENMKEYLALADIESEIVLETAIDYQKAVAYDLIVLCRVFMNPHIERLVSLCRDYKIPVIFDADDYVLDPSILHHIASLKGISEAELELHREGMRKHRKSFDDADFFTAPTHYLAGISNSLGKKAYVIRNGLSTGQTELCKELLLVKHSEDTVVRIGYFSGTKTHQQDFATIVPALLDILEEFPNVHLYIGGHLDLDEQFGQFSNRIIRLPFVDIQRLPFHIAKVDINIVPLEVGNPFCEAKSELKYFDAAVLKIPTVASPTDAYTWAIKHGWNGVLALTVDDWRTYLRQLIEDSELRKRMAQRAYDHAIQHYTPVHMVSMAKQVYEDIISEYRTRNGVRDTSLKISFVLPPPTQGSGGHNKIFTAARALSQSGHLIVIYVLNEGAFGTQQELNSFIQGHFGDPQCQIILGTDTVFSCDILCATSWKTAYAVFHNKDRCAEMFYFVQDFEPLFFPMSDDYLRAENTYRMGMHHITYGPWCAKILKEKYGAKADALSFSLDKKIYYSRTVDRRKTNRILFFSRPEMPRRCFWLGLEALYLFHQRNPHVKISLFGSHAINSSIIPFPHENLGVLKVDKLADLYSNIDIGIAFSTTNPSVVPFEMMACRCPVIDLDYNDNYINYGSRENVKLVDFSAQEIALGIEELMKNDALRKDIAEKGYQFVSTFPDDRETFREMERIFLDAFGIEKPSVSQNYVGKH
jgi:glycosyltransferase involved in cell wall biosynthesis